MSDKPTYEELLEMLDQASASLESTLLAHGKDMSSSDKKYRDRIVEQSRELCNRLLRNE